jgi:oxygen-independent coproporphyrinogen III oxidase
MSGSLADLLARGHYHSYIYSYPHKTTYRPLVPAIHLREAWEREDRSALFLYLHVPFCEQRCDYCNLFSLARPPAESMVPYLEALERQAAVLADILAPARFARLSIGGGTPTHLGAKLFDRLFAIAARMGAAGIPTSVEVSPRSADPEILQMLVARGVTRVSVGVQSLLDHEVAAIHRRQSAEEVERTMAAIAGIPLRNVDLIYGLPGQTESSWCTSIARTVELGANEIYLYPLYVRPHTGLYERATGPDNRIALYRAGRACLLQAGFVQLTMRMFRRAGVSEAEGPLYRCQTDGMVGLGVGARSYTRALHYASPYAVTQPGVHAALDSWIAQTDEDFAVARHGFYLVPDEQRRRYLMLSLLEGRFDRGEYLERFGDEVLVHFPELREAVVAGLVEEAPARLSLTELGRECSDVLGYWLQSPAVRALRAEWKAG